MNEKRLICLHFIYLLIIILLMMSIAYADIPSGVKDEYKYNQYDSSIIIIKDRLKELGYFGEKAIFSEFVSEDLRTAVKAFQRQNKVTVDGVINQAFLELLFSDDAVGKDGRLKANSFVVKETPATIESITTNAVKNQSMMESIEQKKMDEEKFVLDPVWAFVIASACFIFGGVWLGRRRNRIANQNNKKSTQQKPEANTNMISPYDMKEIKSIVHNHEINAEQEAKKMEQWDKTLQSIADKKREKYLQQQAEEQQRQALYIAQQEKVKKQREEEERCRQENEDRKRRTIETVKLYSDKYKQMKRIVEKYEYSYNNDVRTEYNLSYVFSNHYSFDTVKPMDALAYLADGNEGLKKGYEIIKNNRKTQQQYQSEMSRCGETKSLSIEQAGIERTRFLTIEKELCKLIELSIKTDLEVTVYLYYRNGGAHALHTYTFHYNEIDFAFSIYPIPDIEYVGAKEEREKMTPKLRYQIMKRDHFRCVICGASAEEGAKLHVDHVQPVSKGGKTVESNLRTLCDRCNLGKSDQYDPNGFN